ncbi:hypothetical protein TWF696_000967 [Orbilia brochopaga]|uniref:Uncharacterized protein n=1 Tax=Orbilia brochopaga TaxID=3140254 RepID=A0AAV9VCX9_9PEZI
MTLPPKAGQQYLPEILSCPSLPGIPSEPIGFSNASSDLFSRKVSSDKGVDWSCETIPPGLSEYEDLVGEKYIAHRH